MGSSQQPEVPHSRVFIVCGKAITEPELKTAFAPYGNIQLVKVVRDKGVAYVTYDKASSAALAIEGLNGAVLNDGRGPKLKVLLADAPQSRNMSQQRQFTEAELSSDPDNIPPRSRLFIVVPKQADSQKIHEDIAVFEDLEYCKTDLIASKGVVFCKFKKSSSALRALEAISERGTVAGSKVKVMLAEPKTKRGRPDASPHDMMYHPMQQAPKMDYMEQLKLMQGLGHMPNMHDYAAISNLSGLANSLGSFNAAAALASNMNNLAADPMQLGAAQGLGLVGSLNNLQSAASPVSPNNAAGLPLSRQRLFAVVHKNTTEDQLARLFRRFHGMEYCDLKKDKATGKSKGLCYVNYSTHEAALEAVTQLNGMEFPPHSGHKLKVMFAEVLGARATSGHTPGSGMHSGHSGMHSGGRATSGGSAMTRSPTNTMSVHGASPSPARTPLSVTRSTGGSHAHGVNPVTPDTVASVSESLANMTLPRVGSAVGGSPENLDRQAARMASPVAVARELMFNVS